MSAPIPTTCTHCGQTWDDLSTVELIYVNEKHGPGRCKREPSDAGES